MNAVFVPLIYAIKLQTNKRKCKVCICTISTHVSQRKNKSKLLEHNRWLKSEPRFTFWQEENFDSKFKSDTVQARSPKKSYFEILISTNSSIATSNGSHIKLYRKPPKLPNWCWTPFFSYFFNWRIITTVLLYAIHQPGSASGIHMPPPLWASLPPPIPSHPSR